MLQSFIVPRKMNACGRLLVLPCLHAKTKVFWRLDLKKAGKPTVEKKLKHSSLMRETL